jgi:hypothetical protein
MLYPQFARSKKKKNQRTGLLDVMSGNIPSGPAPVSKLKETLKSYTAEYNRIEQAKIDAPRLEAEQKLQALQEENIQIMREINADIRAWWLKPISEMKPREAVIDTLGAYELRSGAPLSAEEQRAVAKDLFDGLTGNDIFMQPAAKEKFGMFFSSLVAKRGIAYTLANLVEALDRLVTLGVFTEPRDLTGFLKLQPKPTPKPVPAPAPEPTFDQVLNAHSVESREGREVLVNAVNKAHKEIAIPLFHQWVEHLSRDYKGFTISQEDAEYIIEFLFPRNNWNFMQFENWNKARRAMVAQGKWPDTMLTPVERITKELESIQTSDPRYRETMQRLRNAELAERSKTA